MGDSSKKLVIETDDLPEVPPPGAVPAAGVPSSPGALPSVAGAKPAATAIGGFGGIPRLSSLPTLTSSLIAGVVAAILAWPLSEITPDLDSLTLSTAIFVGAFGLVFGAIFCAWDDIVSGVTGRIGSKLAVGAAAGAITGAISGAIAQAIYSPLIDSALRNVTSEAELDAVWSSPELYLARAIAWAIFGLGIGLTVGIVMRSQKKAINGIIGGALGGAAGGLIFQFIDANQLISSGGLMRLISLSAVGGGIGLAIGLVEVARRQAWLQIASGGMAGKEFIVYHEVTEIGASPKCQITLIKDPAIAPQHCRLIDQANVRTLEALAGNQTLVNGVPITRQRLKTGDRIQMGETVIAYSEKATAA